MGSQRNLTIKDHARPCLIVLKSLVISPSRALVAIGGIEPPSSLATRIVAS